MSVRMKLKALLHGMLAFLLFAGAMHIDLADLRDQHWAIAVMATYTFSHMVLYIIAPMEKESFIHYSYVYMDFEVKQP
jgi:hypothetical protein